MIKGNLSMLGFPTLVSLIVSGMILVTFIVCMYILKPSMVVYSLSTLLKIKQESNQASFLSGMLAYFG